MKGGFIRMDIVPQDLPDAPGIYAIVNRVNQHFYVGSATSLLKRYQHHLRDLGTHIHKNSHLQRAYDLYGSDSFRFEILELVEHVEHLLTREQYYIDTLNPEYNIARTAGSNLGMTYTPETKAKMREARKAHPSMPEQMAKLNADRTGKHQLCHLFGHGGMSLAGLAHLGLRFRCVCHTKI